MNKPVGITVGAAAGFVTILVVYAIKATTGKDIPSEVAAAFTGLVTFVAGYFTGTEPEPKDPAEF